MDLLHTVAHGKNWNAVEYHDEEEALTAKEKHAEVDNVSFGKIQA